MATATVTATIGDDRDATEQRPTMEGDHVGEGKMDASPAGTEEDRQRQSYYERLASDPWEADRALGALQHEDSTEWIDEAAAILRAVCNRPATQQDGSEASRSTERHKVYGYRSLLKRLGIPSKRAHARCDSAINDLVALWTALRADPDAIATARSCLKVWPPSRTDIVNLIIDTASPCGRVFGTWWRKIALNKSSSHTALVAALAHAAHASGRRRAMVERRRQRDAAAEGGGDNNDRYLILCMPCVQRHDVAVLVRIARGREADEAGNVLGRMYRRKPTTDISDLPPPLPAPAVESLPTRLRPYAGMIPALLLVALSKSFEHDLCPDTDDEEDYEYWQNFVRNGGEDDDDYDDYSDGRRLLTDKDFFPRYPEHWTREPCDAVCSVIAEAAKSSIDGTNDSGIPPRVIQAHAPATATLHGARHAWLGECELERLLAVAAAQHALSLFASTRARYGWLADTDTRVHEDGPGPRYICASRTRSLLSQSRSAIVRSEARLASALPSLPVEVADPLAFDVWLAECADARDTTKNGYDDALFEVVGDDNTDGDGQSPQPADRLLDVARHWGFEPSAAQIREPRVLCGALARHAVVRAMPGGDRFAQPPTTPRVGPPLLTTAEHDAIVEVCMGPSHRRFLWTPDVDGLIDRVIEDDPWLSEAFGPDSAAPVAADVVVRVRAVVAEANEQYNVRVDGTTSEANNGIDTHCQILVALAALRSGHDDLCAKHIADGGSARAIGGPLDALYP
ncbi:hypothetical protein pdul_cds_1069 [Pandoravirus dulcis]|uniref:Uncharacterized protein n=1 Tax=Pandoravirus dulcis TaxID=1349409 RepID=S4VVA0_9VIRU|nr:hypothetical protein pdul_cds_1069 [Pandoravirus dulcis]AGO83350.1 hypothetical protein pdul_cds_1069 [Pandoravirus dulcis]